MTGAFTTAARLSSREETMLANFKDLEPTICEAHNASRVLMNFFEHNVSRDKSEPYTALQLDDTQGTCFQFLIADIEDRVNKIREEFYAAWTEPNDEDGTSPDREA